MKFVTGMLWLTASIGFIGELFGETAALETAKRYQDANEFSLKHAAL